MKTVPLAGLIFFGALACLLLPCRRSQVEALQENLWTMTRSLSWHEPVANPVEVLRWDRRTYGLGWTWLAYDRGTTSPGWSVRLEPGALAVYLLAAGGAAGGVVLGAARLRRRSPPTAG